MTHAEEDREDFCCLAGISNALLSTVLSLQPVIRVFALRVNPQTVKTQLSQVPRRFCRITCEPGLGPSYRPLICHSRVVKYTSSLLQQWAFALWGQATIEFTCHDLFASHVYTVVLCAHPVRGESHIQRNATGEVATVPVCCTKGGARGEGGWRGSSPPL